MEIIYELWLYNDLPFLYVFNQYNVRTGEGEEQKGILTHAPVMGVASQPLM
jgi:hypothetical protein